MNSILFMFYVVVTFILGLIYYGILVKGALRHTDNREGD